MFEFFTNWFKRPEHITPPPRRIIHNYYWVARTALENLHSQTGASAECTDIMALMIAAKATSYVLTNPSCADEEIIALIERELKDFRAAYDERRKNRDNSASPNDKQPFSGEDGS